MVCGGILVENSSADFVPNANWYVSFALIYADRETQQRPQSTKREISGQSQMAVMKCFRCLMLPGDIAVDPSWKYACEHQLPSSWDRGRLNMPTIVWELTEVCKRHSPLGTGGARYAFRKMMNTIHTVWSGCLVTRASAYERTNTENSDLMRYVPC